MQTTKIPHDYQVECVNAVLAHFAAGNRAAMYVMATGLGKTFTLSLILKELYEIGTVKKVCVALDKGTPLPQIREELLEVLEELGVTINVITPHSKPEEWNCDIVITTLQLLHSRRAQLARDMFDLLVVDEAHHAQARTYRAAIEHFDCDRLAFTATPERSDELDICELFGEPVFNLPLEEAIRRKLGADMEYRVYSDNIDMRLLREYAKRVMEGDRTITRRQLNDTLFLPTLYEKIVSIVRGSSGGQKTIIFCNSRKHVDCTLEHFDGAKPFHTKVSAGERADTLRDFREGDLSEVIAINMLNEAVDFPDAQHIVLLRSTDWINLWKQQIGRGYRGRGKKVIIHDFVANIDRILAVRELGLAITHHGASDVGEKPDALVIDGFAVEFSSEVVEILDLLDRLAGEFYSTVAEASAAAQKMGLLTQPDYKNKYAEDPKLPSCPDMFYHVEWVSWPYFLRGEVKRELYLTLAEASAAAKRLGISTQVEYTSRYKEDSMLPCKPHKAYASEWVNWGHFLRGKAKKKFYPTLAEASGAAIRLGITAAGPDYKKQYRRDPRLHSTPNVFYAVEWKGWAHFLGREPKREFYLTLAEASAAAQRLLIRTMPEYNERYTEDPKLPSAPHQFYPSEWLSVPDFLGTASLPGRVKSRKK